MANECSTRSYQVDALLCLQILFWLALFSWLQEQRATLSWEFIKDRFSYGDAYLNSYRYADTWHTAIADHTPRLLAVSPLFTVLTIVFVAYGVSMLVRWLYFHWLSGLLILFTTCAQSRQRSGTHRSQRAIHSSQTLSRSTANCCCYIFHLAADVCVCVARSVRVVMRAHMTAVTVATSNPLATRGQAAAPLSTFCEFTFN